MRPVRVDQLAAGTVLARNVETGAGIPLLRAGVTVTERYRRALLDNGIAQVWIQDDLSEGVEPNTIISDETRRAATAAVSTALDAAQSALTAGGPISAGAVQALAEVAQAITREVLASPHTAVHLADMMGADQYLRQHVVDVTALGVLIGDRLLRDVGWTDHTGRRRWDGREVRLPKLALGLLLHDLGKLAVPPEVLNKPGPLDAAEWEIMRSHPMLGVGLLSEETSYLTRAVVRSHHERIDGRGYPDGLSGTGIHQFARVAAVADVYDAITSERSYKAGAAPHVGFTAIIEGEGIAFCPEAVRAFRRVVVPYPPGYEVGLADGRRGIVVGVGVDDPLRPTVRVRAAGGGVEEIAGAELADASVLAAAA